MKFPLKYHLGCIYFYIQTLNSKIKSPVEFPEDSVFSKFFRNIFLVPIIAEFKKLDISECIPIIEYKELSEDAIRYFADIHTFFYSPPPINAIERIDKINNLRNVTANLKRTIKIAKEIDFHLAGMIEDRVCFLMYEISLLNTYKNFHDSRFNNIHQLLKDLMADLSEKGFYAKNPYEESFPDDNPMLTFDLMTQVIIITEDYLNYNSAQSLSERAKARLCLKEIAKEKVGYTALSLKERKLL